jgi:hypothetical protein
MLKDNGEGKYEMTRVDLNNAFIFEDKIWQIEKPIEDVKEILCPKAVLKIITKPLVYNSDNVPIDMVMQLADAEILDQLKALDKLVRN